jgi:hypothetical protein
MFMIMTRILLSFALSTTILVCPLHAQRLQKLKVAEVVRNMSSSRRA